MAKVDSDIDGDPHQLREHTARIAPVLKEHDDSSYVRHVAENLAKSIDKFGHFRLLVIARTIPQGTKFGSGFTSQRVQRVGFAKPGVPRSKETDEGVEKLLAAIEAALVQLEDHQAQAEANAALPVSERRRLVLEAAAAIDAENGGTYFWVNDVRWRTHMSMANLSDALEYGEHYGEIERHPEDREPIRRFRLTFIGRERAASGRMPEDEAAVSQVHLHRYESGSVQQMGTGNVLNIQNINVITIDEGIARIRDFLPQYSAEDRERVARELATIEEEQQGQHRASRIKSALRAIQKITIEAQKTFAPTIEAVVSGVVSAIGP